MFITLFMAAWFWYSARERQEDPTKELNTYVAAPAT